jgi:hypothetical protein
MNLNVSPEWIYGGDAQMNERVKEKLKTRREEDWAKVGRPAMSIRTDHALPRFRYTRGLNEKALHLGEGKGKVGGKETGERVYREWYPLGSE